MADYTGDPRQAPAGTVVQMWGGTDPVYAEGNGKFYQLKNGRKSYVPPFVVMQGYHPGTEVDATGQLTPEAQQERTAHNIPGASLFHNRGAFSDETGDYEQSINWGNILSMVIGGALTAGAASAMMGGGAAAEAAASTAAATGSVDAGLAAGGIGAGAAAIPTTAGIAGAGALGLPATAGLGTAGAIGGAGAAGVGAAGVGAGSSGTAAAGGSTAATGGIVGGLKSYASDPKNWLDTASQVGDLLSANAAGRASGRVTEAGVDQAQDRNAIALYNSLLANNQAQNNFGISRGVLSNANARTDLDQRNFKLDAPGKRAGNAVHGDILSRAQDVSIGGVSPNIPVPTISGGLRPSMFSANTRALGENMSAQALREQQAGDNFDALPALPDWKAPPAPPTLTPTPQASGLDTALTNTGNILQIAGNVGGTLLDYYNRYKGKPLPKTTMDGATSNGWYA